VNIRSFQHRLLKAGTDQILFPWTVKLRRPLQFELNALLCANIGGVSSFLPGQLGHKTAEPVPCVAGVCLRIRSVGAITKNSQAMIWRTSMNAEMNPEPFVDATRAAQFLGIKPRRLLEMARAGHIPGYPLGTGLRRTWRFRLTEITKAIGVRR
jgi:hypothetical protein